MLLLLLFASDQLQNFCILQAAPVMKLRCNVQVLPILSASAAIECLRSTPKLSYAFRQNMLHSSLKLMPRPLLLQFARYARREICAIGLRIAASPLC